MQVKKNHILSVLALAMASQAAFAQGTSLIVPPPPPPGAQVQPSVAVAAPTSVNSPVAGAKPAQAVESAGQATSPALIDITLPDAPKPAVQPATAKDDSCQKQAAKCDLHPVAAVKKVVKKAESVAEKKPEAPKAPVDPFSGVRGTPVSDSQLNRLVFPEPVAGIYFQENSPLPECAKDAGENDPCKPVFLNGKRVVLLQLRAGAKNLFQSVVHLESGRFVTLNLMPVAGPGAVVRVDGAEDGASDARLAAAKAGAGPAANESMAASEQNVSMLARFAKGDIPGGFEPVAVSGNPVRFEHFDVIQRASWDNGANLRVHMYQVYAHGANPVLINASLFRSQNVRALALDRETITNKQPATLFMLEFVPAEQN